MKEKQHAHIISYDSLHYLVLQAAHSVRTGKPYGFFALDQVLGTDQYVKSRSESQFNAYRTDEDFLDLGYTDIVGGPFNATHGPDYWRNEVSHTLTSKKPHQVVFYLRNPVQTESRIFIPLCDFYGGLTNEEAQKKYGKRTYNKMVDYLQGITMSRDANGDLRTPYSDLEYAHRMVLGKKPPIELWD